MDSSEIFQHHQDLSHWYAERFDALNRALDEVLKPKVFRVKRRKVRRVNPSEKVYLAIKDGARTWPDIESKSGVKGDTLGYALSALFEQKRIKSLTKGDDRIYLAA